MSKAEVEIVETQVSAQPMNKIHLSLSLNPLDVMFSHQVIRYDVINMPRLA